MESSISKRPQILSKILTKSDEIGFTMPSDELVGSLLQSLAVSKPNANILELGTGLGLAVAWMANGMDKGSKIVSIENDHQLVDIANGFFQDDPRISIFHQDGTDWIKNYKGDKFDLVFADAWPGKYDLLDETLDLVRPGGFYVIDDMVEQPNWPKGHSEKASQLISELETKDAFYLTKMNWSTGVILMTKKIK